MQAGTTQHDEAKEGASTLLRSHSYLDPSPKGLELDVARWVQARSAFLIPVHDGMVRQRSPCPWRGGLENRGPVWPGEGQCGFQPHRAGIGTSLTGALCGCPPAQLGGSVRRACPVSQAARAAQLECEAGEAGGMGGHAARRVCGSDPGTAPVHGQETVLGGLHLRGNDQRGGVWTGCLVATHGR